MWIPIGAQRHMAVMSVRQELWTIEQRCHLCDLQPSEFLGASKSFLLKGELLVRTHVGWRGWAEHWGSYDVRQSRPNCRIQVLSQFLLVCLLACCFFLSFLLQLQVNDWLLLILRNTVLSLKGRNLNSNGFPGRSTVVATREASQLMDIARFSIWPAFGVVKSI